MPRLFCSRPFSWFEVTGWYEPKGDVYMCCPKWLDKPIGNLQTQPLNDIWNGPQAQDIRRSILDGTFKYCSRSLCPFLQTESGPVQTLDEVNDERLLLAINKQLTQLPYGPLEIICSYDLSCNLSCPSCRTLVIVETRNARQILQIQDRLTTEALKDAEFLLITGSGDPFGSPFFNRWLRSMSLADMPHLQHIHLHTNALLWTPAMWAKIANSVRALVRSAEISIDAATSGTYARNRRGGDFHRLLDNLEFISQLRTRGPLERLIIHMVVQENNFSEMPKFVQLGQRFGVDAVYFSRLQNYGTYSQDEFEKRDVCHFTHPRHGELIELLGHPLLDDRRVDLGNLTQLSITGDDRDA